MSAQELVPTWLLLSYVGLVGLVLGSYVNVVVHRIPAGQSTAAPPSSCPRCGHQIRWYDNIPVLSWLLLRARCRDCSEPISWRYPAVELLTAVLLVALALALPDASAAALLATAALVVGGVALTLIDVEHHRLPDKVVAATAVGIVVPLTIGSLLAGEWTSLLRAALTALVLCALYLLAAIVRPGGMGLGDVKLSAPLGFLLGWWGLEHALVGAFAPFALSMLAVVWLAASGRLRRGGGVPFGPFMVVGTLLSVLYAPHVANWYLTLTGLA